MLKLKLQLFGHQMWRTDSFEKTLMMGKLEGKRRGQQTMKWLDGIIDSMDMSLSKLRGIKGQGSLVCRSPWGRRELDRTEGLNRNFPHLDVCFLSHVSFQLLFLQISNFSGAFTLPFPSGFLSYYTWHCTRDLLNYHHFQKFFFLLCVQLGWLSLLCLPARWSIPLYHLIYYWFLPVYFSFQLFCPSALLGSSLCF